MKVVTGFIGMAVQVTFVTVGIVTVAVLTKPSDASFQTYIEESMGKEIYRPNDNIVDRACKKIAVKTVNWVLVSDVRDVGIAKIGRISTGNGYRFYIGVFNTWLDINKH